MKHVKPDVDPRGNLPSNCVRAVFARQYILGGSGLITTHPSEDADPAKREAAIGEKWFAFGASLS